MLVILNIKFRFRSMNFRIDFALRYIDVISSVAWFLASRDLQFLTSGTGGCCSDVLPIWHGFAANLSTSFFRTKSKSRFRKSPSEMKIFKNQPFFYLYKYAQMSSESDYLDIHTYISVVRGEVRLISIWNAQILILIIKNMFLIRARASSIIGDVRRLL